MGKNGVNIKQRMRHDWALRRLIQLAFFLAAPGLYSAAYSGVRYVFEQVGKTMSFELNAFIAVLLVLLGYTFLFGRFFCGYACAFGFLGDVMHDVSAVLQKSVRGSVWKMPARRNHILSYGKYLVLAVGVTLCVAGRYSDYSKYDPWQVFAAFRTLDFTLDGRMAGLVVLLAILIGMCLVERFFCRFLCPMGAVFSMLPVIPFSTVSRKDETCIRGCSRCHQVCPADYDLLDRSGECFHCMQCTSACPNPEPREGARMGRPSGKRKLKGNEWWLILIQAAVLYSVTWAAQMYM